jgi:hypothetical protein
MEAEAKLYRYRHLRLESAQSIGHLITLLLSRMA